MNKSYCILFVKMIIISSLAFSCQGLNDNKIDPTLLTHAKAIIDFDSLNSPYLQVAQFDCKTAWLYELSSHYGLVSFNNGKYTADKVYEPPTDIIKYKEKYILFFLRNKKPISRGLLIKAMNLDSDVISTPHIDTRSWFYLKDKHSDKSVYVRFDGKRKLNGISFELPQIRYFSCDSQDSAVYYSHIINMEVGSSDIYGTESDGEKFSNLDQIKLAVKISNKADSSLYISTLPEKYGHFVIKNGKNTLSFHVVDTTNINEVSPGMYEITAHDDAVLYLSTEKAPIRFENTSPKKYPNKIYQLLHDSVYYIPTHTPPENERRYIWNKRYKIYLTYLSNYDYYIDGTEYTVYYDGEIEEEFSRKIEKSSRK